MVDSCVLKYKLLDDDERYTLSCNVIVKDNRRMYRKSFSRLDTNVGVLLESTSSR